MMLEGGGDEMMVRLVSCGVRECMHAGSTRSRERERQRHQKYEKKEDINKKKIYITEYVHHCVCAQALQ
jgi:hypothetical protein